MTYGLSPLLEGHRLFASRDIREVRGFLDRKDFSLDVNPRANDGLDARINGVYWPGMFLGYVQYGPPVAVQAAAGDDYWLQMSVSGSMRIFNGKETVICDQRRAAFASPTHSDRYRVEYGPGCGGVRLSLFKANLMSCLAALLGDQPQKSLTFSPGMDLSQGHGRSIVEHILLAVRDLDQPESSFWHEATMTAFQNFIMTSLLLSQPHSFSDALARLDKNVTTREIKRAIDFIHANLDMPITIKDIIDVTGVPGRTLFKHFRDYQGISPMQYLRNARFDRVRRARLAAETHASVTMIAMEAGFMHLGRFAVEYRQRFGESPSETLRRRKS
jgi:AraC-like DNA-binding protein